MFRVVHAVTGAGGAREWYSTIALLQQRLHGLLHATRDTIPLTTRSIKTYTHMCASLRTRSQSIVHAHEDYIYIDVQKYIDAGITQLENSE